MTIDIKGLKVNDVVITGDSYGYNLIRITSEAKEIRDPWYSKGYLEIECELVKNPEEKIKLGGVPGPYAPNFFSLTEWLSWYPPENRLRMVDSLKLRS